MSTSNESQRFLQFLIAAVIATALILPFAFFSWIRDDEEDNPLLGWLVMVVVTIVAAAIVWLVNRKAYESGTAESQATRSLVLGVLAAIAILAFWSGVWGPLSVAAIVMGLKATGRGEKTKAYIGIGLGAIAFAVASVFIIIG